MKFTESFEKDYATSDNDAERSFARLYQSGAGDQIKAWIEAECARGESPEMLLIIMANFFVSLHASVAGSLLCDRHFSFGKKLLKSTIDATYVRTARICHEQVSLATQVNNDNATMQ